MRALALLIALPFAASPAFAQQPEAVPELTKELKASAPSPWEIRVRWRDGQLLASITPWPYQEAFKLWYDQTRLAETLRDLVRRAARRSGRSSNPTKTSFSSRLSAAKAASRRG